MVSNLSKYDWSQLESKKGGEGGVKTPEGGFSPEKKVREKLLGGGVLLLYTETG